MRRLAFTIRKDQNGYRPVFLLGNMLGQCPYSCKFCGVKTFEKATAADIVNKFDKLFLKYQRKIHGPYHPVIYNRGNVTDPKELPCQLLDYILDRFNEDRRVLYVSLNSREKYTTSNLLNHLAQKGLSYPIHFILGIESFSARTSRVLGKITSGELERFSKKLEKFNVEFTKGKNKRNYVFGLDVNLLFLPELYLDEGRSRRDNRGKVLDGLEDDLLQLLRCIKRNVPVEVNIHPYYRIDTLPYEDADLDDLMYALPRLQNLIEQHNRILGNYQTHLFLGIEGKGYSNRSQKAQIRKWHPFIDKFNQTGRINKIWKDELLSSRNLSSLR